jgi:hypothetical protein
MRDMLLTGVAGFVRIIGFSAKSVLLAELSEVMEH